MNDTKKDTALAETVLLSKPVQAHGKEVDTLTFREPRGLDISQCGIPFALLPGKDGEGEVIQPDAAALRKMMSRLAGVPPSSIDMLTAGDWMRCMGAVMGFFGASGSAGTPSTPPSTSPGSGG